MCSPAAMAETEGRAPHETVSVDCHTADAHLGWRLSLLALRPRHGRCCASPARTARRHATFAMTAVARGERLRPCTPTKRWSACSASHDPGGDMKPDWEVLAELGVFLNLDPDEDDITAAAFDRLGFPYPRANA